MADAFRLPKLFGSEGVGQGPGGTGTDQDLGHGLGQEGGEKVDRVADDGVGLGVGDEGVDTDLTVGREVDLELEGLGQEVGPGLGPGLGPGAEDEGVIPGRTRDPFQDPGPDREVEDIIEKKHG